VPFNDHEARKLTCSGFFHDFLSKAKNATENQGYKFALYQTHDIMLIGLLSCLEIKER